MNKVNWNTVKNILEPSAGLGHIIDYLNKDLNKHNRFNINAIELDNKCRNQLLLKKYKCD